MIITTQTLLTAVAIMSAVGAILGGLFAVYRWYLRQGQQDREIEKIKKENTLICYGLSACLDGLMQLGCNHTVPDAKNKLDKYINQQAHGQVKYDEKD